MDVKRIKYFDKIVPTFTSGRLTPTTPIAQGTAPHTVSFVDSPTAKTFAAGQTGWMTLIPTIYNADTLGIRPDLGGRPITSMPDLHRALGRDAIDVEAALEVLRGGKRVTLSVKPALPYLDVLANIRRNSLLPVAAYQVSGEYAMIKFAAQADAIDERRVVRETLGSIKRAGADLIMTYFAMDIAREGF
jgi:hypothetical protein